ncbi:hypothetical protein LEP1GSC104_4852 [Leptospira interrogans str. UI 12621]|uniref:Uncharacterized protein n=1 Tax=Leptospira interrogans str. UI 12621 TaxID=1049937 RepID=A0A0F6HB88_LEPIR|nr:hypothetical protein LEP1GSC104_4852 [Leptospira interrogans str. UI 12621]
MEKSGFYKTNLLRRTHIKLCITPLWSFDSSRFGSGLFEGEKIAR